MKKISIIVPVYKTKEEYLRQCIESLMNQTLKDIEIILIDDGSPDNNGAICDEYGKRDARIHVFHHETNRGVAHARNTGIEAAQGVWVTFVDSDDWIELDACEKLYDRVATLDTEILLFGAFLEQKEHSKKAVFDNREIAKADDELKQAIHASMIGKNTLFGFSKNTISTGITWAKLIKRSLIMETNVRFNQLYAYCEDQKFYVDLMEYCTKIANYPIHLYHYRDLSSSISRSYNPNVIKIYDRLLNYFSEYITINSKSHIYLDSLYHRSITSVFKIQMQFIFNPRNRCGNRNRIKLFRSTIKKEPYATALRKIDKNTLNYKQYIEVLLIRSKLYLLLSILYKIKRAYHLIKSFT